MNNEDITYYERYTQFYIHMIGVHMTQHTHIHTYIPQRTNL